MTKPHIVQPAEVLTYLKEAAAVRDADLGLVNLLLPLVEGRVRDYLGYDVTPGSYTEFYPDYDANLWLDPFADDPQRYGLSGPVVSVAGVTSTDYAGVAVLRVRHRPVTAVTEVRVCEAGYGVAANFPTASVLAPDSYLVRPPDGLFLPNGAWPALYGSVMVTYSAGYTPAQLQDDAAAIRLGTLMAVAEAYDEAGRRHRTGSTLLSESFPEYKATYAPRPQGGAVDVVLSGRVMRQLDAFVCYRR